MQTSNGLKLSDSTNRKSCFLHIIPAAVLFLIIVLIGNASITTNYKERILYWRISIPMQDTQSDRCKDQCRPYGNGAVPKGIMSVTSNLERQPLRGCLKEKKPKESKSLLALAVGIKQKETVDKIVRKFPSRDFTVMLFHYDGVVVEWGDLPWSDSALHVSAMDQTKWWFAKRFLHPDIVAEYKYIFIWDEDLGVENFHPGRRIFKPNGGGRCYANSTEPPCTGWVEMMAPVFSRRAWRCAWYLIQNDLIHAWGLDKKLGYCAQGDRTKSVGVVDTEYIVHHGLTTLGGSHESKGSEDASGRVAVRIQSSIEMDIFNKRWRTAVEEHDNCWTDPYLQ